MFKIAKNPRRILRRFFIAKFGRKLRLGGEKMVRLTVKQENFCLEYAKTGNATKAYKSAYSPNNSDSAAGSEAHKLLKNPKVKAKLKEIQETHNAEKIMQIEEMKTRLTKIARDDSSIKNALKAIELLAKIGGLFISKQELEINSSIPVVIKDNV